MTQPASNNPPSTPSMNPLAVAVDALPKLLSIPPELVEAHVAAGAPVAPDGTVNLVAYCAWLNREMNPTAA